MLLASWIIYLTKYTW